MPIFCQNPELGFYYFSQSICTEYFSFENMFATLKLLYTKVLFTDCYTWQNFRLQFLHLVNRLYPVIHKTQKS